MALFKAPETTTLTGLDKMALPVKENNAFVCIQRDDGRTRYLRLQWPEDLYKPSWSAQSHDRPPPAFD